MQCGWLLPQVVNQKQTTNTLGVSAWNFMKGNNFLLASFLIHAYAIWEKLLVFPILHESRFFLQTSQYWLPPVSHTSSVKLLSWHVGQIQHHRTGGFSRWASPVFGRPTDEVSVKCSLEDSETETNDPAVCRSKEMEAVMQITADSVKMKPFFFICLSVARRTATHSHYDWFQTLAIMATTLWQHWFSQRTASQAGTAIPTLYESTWGEFWTPTYSLLPSQLKTNSISFPSVSHLLIIPQSVSEPELPAVLPPAPQGIEELSEAVEGLGTVEEVMRYLEPERWRVDMEELYKPSWHVLGKSFIHSKKARGRNFTIPLTTDMSRSTGSVHVHALSVPFKEELILIC